MFMCLNVLKTNQQTLFLFVHLKAYFEIFM